MVSSYSMMVMLAALAFALGGVGMKFSDGLLNVSASLIVFCLFVGGAALQIMAMKGTELSVTYILVLGFEAVLSFGFGVIAFRESISLLKMVGALIVVLGIVVLRSSVA